MRRAALILCIQCMLVASEVQAASHTYVVVIGNNAPPLGESNADLPYLRYADDDAVRYFQFFARFADRIALLTVLDQDTQRRYPKLGAVAKVPSMVSVRATLAEFRAAVYQDRDHGIESVFYFVFSGHGAVSADGIPFLALTDGGVSRQTLYDEVLAGIPATYTHLIVDACNADAVVGSRGLFDKELDAKTAPVSPADALAMFERQSVSRFPHVGVLVASASGQEAHEWSRLESGVFTHELLSALSGAADVNGDGIIEYSEAQAFIAAANREVKDPRAVPHVIARAPAVWQNVPLVTLASMRRVSWLRGNPASLGHFYVELANGQRYLDANVSDTKNVTVALPDDAMAFLRTRESEAELPIMKNRGVEIGKLSFGHTRSGEKGSIDNAYRQALFASSYTPAYYKGFIDSTGGTSVAFDLGATVDLTTTVHTSEEAATRPWLIASLAGGAGALLVSGVTLGLALKAKSDFDHTSVQRTARDANTRFVQYRAAAVASGIVALGCGGLAWWLWPSQPSSPVVGAVSDGNGVMLTWQGSW